MRDIVLADTVYIAFTTRAFATGIPTVLAGTPVVSAYEDAGLTQITAGITLGIDHDSVVGLNMLTIVATGANGFEDNKDYNLVITTGTVGGVSVVGEVVGQFSIQRAPVNWANVSNPTTALDLSGTDVQLVDTVTTYTGNTPQTADHTAGIADIPTVAEFNARTLLAASYFDPAADTVANVTTVATTTTNTDMRGTDGANTTVPDAAGVAPTAIENRQEMDNNSVDLNALITAIGTAGAGLTDLGGMSTAMKAEVNAEMLDVLVTDTFAELSGVPAATASLADKIAWICMLARNQGTQTSTTKTLLADDTTTPVATSTINDDGTTFTRGEFT